MRLKTMALCVAIAAIGAGLTARLRADDLSVTMAPGVDVKAFRTFTVRHVTVDSGRPELDNRLFVKKLTRTIEAALEARGLKAAAAQPDLIVDVTLTGEDFSVGDRPPARGLGPQPRRFTEGTLVIDLSKAGDVDPVWRGTYRDDESTGSKLMQKLPDDARKLIEKLPAVR